MGSLLKKYSCIFACFLLLMFIFTSSSYAGTYINTYYKPINIFDDRTDLTIDLITGKSHQIRAHMSHIGHPLLGDDKYGKRELNKRLGINYQLLHAYNSQYYWAAPSGYPHSYRQNALSSFHLPNINNTGNPILYCLNS